jgi:glycosyltransferase involved in cell wall biosynthesis
MSPDGAGFSQTLYNVVSFCNSKDLLSISEKKDGVKTLNQSFYKNLSYKFEFIKLPQNRLGVFLMPVYVWITFSYNYYFRSFRKLKNAITKFNPDVIIACPNGPVGAFMANKLLRKHTSSSYCVIPYFMDDWMHNIKTKWLGGNIQNEVKKLLQQHLNWMMISNELGEIIANRYNLKPIDVLEIYNPVDISGLQEIQPLQKKSSGFNLVYAGSLWPMHFDAFKVVAEAVAQLRETGYEIRLLVYTSPEMWDWRKKDLELLNVLYGGHLKYNEIQEHLSQSDALLLTSSFTDEFYNHSRSSIQTKVTDYLKAGSLIISCGPSYSVNHSFLKRNQCGVCIESNNPKEIATVLKEIFINREQYSYMVANGYNVLKNELSFEKAHGKLIRFINAAKQKAVQ